MQMMKAIVLLLLIGQVNGFFGIGSFFGSAKRSTETLTRVVQEQGAALQKLVPDVHLTLKHVRNSTDDLVNTAKRLERRLEQSLGKLDDIAKNIGQNINHIVDIVIVLSCLALFCVCSKINSSTRDDHVKYEFLTILMGISLITATAVILRVFFISVLDLGHLMTTTTTLKYCVIYPVGIVVVWKVLRLVWFVLCQIGTVVYFFILAPRLIIFVTLDGPILWVWRAYKYAPEMKSRKALFITISLPWLMFTVSLLVYNLIVKQHDDRDQIAFGASLLAAYLYFYATSMYLFMYHQRPAPQERLRALYRENNTEDNSNRHEVKKDICKKRIMGKPAKETY